MPVPTPRQRNLSLSPPPPPPRPYPIRHATQVVARPPPPVLTLSISAHWFFAVLQASKDELLAARARADAEAKDVEARVIRSETLASSAEGELSTLRERIQAIQGQLAQVGTGDDPGAAGSGGDGRLVVWVHASVYKTLLKTTVKTTTW